MIPFLKYRPHIPPAHDPGPDHVSVPIPVVLFLLAAAPTIFVGGVILGMMIRQ
jgi:hypothetical protein